MNQLPTDVGSAEHFSEIHAEGEQNKAIASRSSSDLDKNIDSEILSTWEKQEKWKTGIQYAK